MSDTAAATTALRDYTAGELRAILGRLRISATELSRRMGVSQAYVWRRLDGQTAFDLDDLEMICRILNISLFDLLPPPIEGRLVTSGGATRKEDRKLSERYTHLHERTRPIGQRKHVKPDPSLARPSRIRTHS